MWSLTLREECRLRVYEKRTLREIISPKRDENGKCRRLHNKEIHSYTVHLIFRVINPED
jgi:hypothetical protein